MFTSRKDAGNIKTALHFCTESQTSLKSTLHLNSPAFFFFQFTLQVQQSTTRLHIFSENNGLRALEVLLDSKKPTI